MLLAACAFAQYGPIVDQAAGEEALTVGTAIRLVGVSAGSFAPELGVEEARVSLVRLGIQVPRTANEGRITYGEFAFLLTQLFDQAGSLSARLIPGSRTSFRDLQDRGLIPLTARAGFTISGPDALLLQRRFLEARKALP